MVCQVKHLHAVEQLKIAHGGKQVKEFQFQYSLQPASCVNNEENCYIITNTHKCNGIELTYLVAFVLVADEGAEKYGERQFDMCFCPSSEYVCSTFFRPIMSQ